MILNYILSKQAKQVNAVKRQNIYMSPSSSKGPGHICNLHTFCDFFFLNILGLFITLSTFPVSTVHMSSVVIASHVNSFCILLDGIIHFLFSWQFKWTPHYYCDYPCMPSLWFQWFLSGSLIFTCLFIVQSVTNHAFSQWDSQRCLSKNMALTPVQSKDQIGGNDEFWIRGSNGDCLSLGMRRCVVSHCFRLLSHLQRCDSIVYSRAH